MKSYFYIPVVTLVLDKQQKGDRRKNHLRSPFRGFLFSPQKISGKGGIKVGWVINHTHLQEQVFRKYIGEIRVSR
jgi:hypothetical protein